MDYVDVYQIHRLDAETMEEIVEVLHDVVKSGKARYIGASTIETIAIGHNRLFII